MARKPAYTCPRDQVKEIRQAGDKLTFVDAHGEPQELDLRIYSPTMRFGGDLPVQREHQKPVTGMDFLISKTLWT